jgi:cation:H+ antiporter
MFPILPVSVEALTTFALLAVSFVIILAGAELFTNGIEWLGDRLGLGQGMVGSVLAAVGTALPETLIPIIAILFTGTPEAEEIGIGAILGAPFMLSTAAMFVTGTAVLVYSRTRKRSSNLNVDRVILSRDLRYFLLIYVVALVMGVPGLPRPEWLKYVVGGLLLLGYVLYVYRTSQDPRSEHGEALSPLYFGRPVRGAPTRLIVLQVAASLILIVAGARLFVTQVETLAHTLGISALVLSLVIAPLATELPEKFNSVIWVRQRKDTLAMGNISGAMVFQSSVPVTVGLWFTPWILDQFSLASGVIALGAGLLLQLYLRSGSSLSGREMVSLGAFYAAFIAFVVAVPH